jgi:hypothetical protein
LSDEKADSLECEAGTWASRDKTRCYVTFPG